MRSVTVEPAGMTTRPAAFFTAVPTVARTVSPALFVRDEIRLSIRADTTVPAGRVATPDDRLEPPLADPPDVPERDVPPDAVASPRSFSVAFESEGASCRS